MIWATILFDQMNVLLQVAPHVLVVRLMRGDHFAESRLPARFEMHS